MIHLAVAFNNLGYSEDAGFNDEKVIKLSIREIGKTNFKRVNTRFIFRFIFSFIIFLYIAEFKNGSMVLAL